VRFDPQKQCVDFAEVGWLGPDWEWLEQNGFYPVSIFLNGE
jgi:hypothetical protein